MTQAVKTTRQGYDYEARECKFVYVRRPHPKDNVELCLGPGDHTCDIIKLTDKQLADLTRDLIALFFTPQVKA